jgi:N-acetylglutamate synthase-like GNAT family acetyltransferase
MQLRQATQSDQKIIKRLVHEVGINPMSLDWRHFIIAEDKENPKSFRASEPFGSIIGIGQIKQHGDGSRELASIAVIPERRGQGIASEIIRALLADEHGDVYLTCRAQLESFYNQFGFRKVGRDEMTPYFKRLHRIGNFFARLAKTEMLVMKK